MRKLYLTVGLIPLFMLAACGGGGGAGQPAVVTELVVVTSTPGTPARATAGIRTPTERATATPIPTPTPTLHPAFPTPEVGTVDVAEQVFENGRMFALLDRHEIWVAILTRPNSGEWLVFKDKFKEGKTPELNPTLTPPAGLLQPVRGFGLVWRENADVQERIGWAKLPEFGFTTPYRYDAGGFINEDGKYVPRPGKFALTSLGGETFIFYEADSTFDLIPAPRSDESEE
jgi:hypothetical protein